MSRSSLSGVERHFDASDIIVSKTDMKGIIQYANRLFIKLSGYDERRLMGAPHKILRHPDMPKCIFKVWWDHLNRGEEVFAYVVNRCKNGDHYWVSAHGTVSYNENQEVIGLHSDRRKPKPEVLNNTIKPLYAELLDIEKRDGMAAGETKINHMLDEKGMTYNEWFFSLQ